MMEDIIKTIEEEQVSIDKEIDRRKEFKDDLDVLSGGTIDFNYLLEIEIMKGQINILETIKKKLCVLGGISE